MASTRVVEEILQTPMVPADRSFERVQRVFTGMFFGSFVGSIIAVLMWGGYLSVWAYAAPIILAIILAAVGYGLYRLMKMGHTEDPVPVVAKVLGTSESAASRELRGGAVAIPVVVRPLEGRDFRSIIALRSTKDAPAKDLDVGSILALEQIEVGLGDLRTTAVTDEQRELMKRWAASGKLVSNTVAPLPLRRSPLERQPLSSALEFYLGIGVGIILAIFSIYSLAG